jgi:hypothetical protein
MKYDQFRLHIRSGDVLAWSHREGWFESWHSFKVNLVRLFQMSEYSHVGLAWNIAGRVFVIESVNPVVRIVPLSNLLPCYHLTGQGGMSDAQVRRALALVGKGKYSEVEAIAAQFGANDLANDKWECAEFVNYVLGSMRFKATPSGLVNYLLRDGAMLTEITE